MMRSVSTLPEGSRKRSGQKINDAAIDLLGLSAVAKKAHWNVRGPLFGQLHDLFDKLYNEAASHADTLNEHCRMLGISVRGDHVDVAKSAEADPLGDETGGIELCEFLFEQIRSTLSENKKAQNEVRSLGDEEGFQLLLDASIAISKLGWMVGSYLEDDEEAKSEKEPKTGSESD